jgi:hypothetical protein
VTVVILIPNVFGLQHKRQLDHGCAIQLPELLTRQLSLRRSLRDGPMQCATPVRSADSRPGTVAGKLRAVSLVLNERRAPVHITCCVEGKRPIHLLRPILAITAGSPTTPRGHWRWQEPHRPMMPRGCVKDGNIELPLGHFLNELDVVPTNTGPSLGARTSARCRLLGKPTELCWS